MKKTIRRYSELMEFDNFEDRFKYLQLDGIVGAQTFGYDRYLNQVLYQRSREWKESRRFVILRDNGCDLAIPDREIYGKVIIHHMNPITEEQILNRDPDIYNPEFLICVSLQTHNAIHYSDDTQIIKVPIARSKNDTKLW